MSEMAAHDTIVWKITVALYKYLMYGDGVVMVARMINNEMDSVIDV